MSDTPNGKQKGTWKFATPRGTWCRTNFCLNATRLDCVKFYGCTFLFAGPHHLDLGNSTKLNSLPGVRESEAHTVKACSAVSRTQLQLYHATWLHQCLVRPPCCSKTSLALSFWAKQRVRR